MRKDIEIHINTGDITLTSKNKVALRDFQWVDRPSNMEQRYLYGEVSVPGYVNESAIIQQGLYVEIPYTPIYKEIKLRIKRCFSDTEYQYVVNPKDGSNWFVVKASIGGAPIDNVFAPQLVSISEDKFYLTFEGKEIRLYSGNESDMSVIKANWQNRNLMLKCVPGNNFRYPLTGVGLIRWTNSNISVTTLAQTLKEQFASDGTPVQSAQYDFDKKMLYMKLDTSKVDDDGNI